MERTETVCSQGLIGSRIRLGALHQQQRASNAPRAARNGPAITFPAASSQTLLSSIDQQKVVSVVISRRVHRSMRKREHLQVANSEPEAWRSAEKRQDSTNWKAFVIPWQFPLTK